MCGGAEDFDPCIMLADADKTVKGQGIKTTYEQCLSGNPDIQNHACCQMARVLYDQKTDCGDFPTVELQDQCHHIVGVKEKNINECKLIKNERNRVGCIIIAKAYQADPDAMK